MNKDWSFFSHIVLKLPLSVLLRTGTWHHDTATVVAALHNCQSSLQRFSRMSMQVDGLPTIIACSDRINSSLSYGVGDRALTRPVRTSTGVDVGGAAASLPACTQPQNKMWRLYCLLVVLLRFYQPEPKPWFLAKTDRIQYLGFYGPKLHGFW